MRQALLSISGICMTAALCSQLMASNRYSSAIQIVLGFEIIGIFLSILNDIAQILG